MKKLLYEGKPMKFTLTKSPISNIKQSPKPEGVGVEDLDPAHPEYNQLKTRILSHPNYSEAEVVYLKPGINVFDNDEHAEYLYKLLGNPVEGGYIPLSDGSKRMIKNPNIIHEVNEKGEPIEGEWFAKYRQPVGYLHTAR